MRILCVDVGTGTQDIFLYDSQVDLENGFKLVVPAPTMRVHRRLKEATRRGDTILLTGVTMGGGPSHWAAEAHIEAGFPVFATPNAARSFNDDLDEVTAMGIQVVSEDEAARLSDDVVRVELRDFDFAMIARALAQQPQVMLLDEPTSHLDVKNQLAIYRMMVRLAHEWPMAVVAVSHEVNLAARFADALVLMRDGAVIASGAPAEVVRADVLRKTYDVEVELIETGAGVPVVVAH